MVWASCASPPSGSHLASVGARGQQRVVAAPAGVAERRALLAVAVDLADEAVDVDHQTPVAGTGPRLPRPLERLGQQPVELTDMPERERTQERAERRRRSHATEQRPQAPGPQHIAVVDAVRAERHRVNQGHDLAPRIRSADAVTKPNKALGERLDPQPRRERRDEHDAGVRHHPLVIEDHPHRVPSDRPDIVHHQGDLLTQDATAPIGRFLPAQEVILR